MLAQQAGFLKIADAASFLGVAPNTLRSWGAQGKIQEYRHPINNYRLYKKSDLDRLEVCLQRPIKVVAKQKLAKKRRPK